MVFEQRLEVLPAVQHADLPNWRVSYGFERIASRVTKERPLHMRGLDLPAMKQHLALVVYQSLRQIQTSLGSLTKPKAYEDIVVGSRLSDPRHLRPVSSHAILHVLVDEWDVLEVVAAPEEIGVARKPDFRERDELAAIAGGFFDKVDRFVDTGLEVEPAGLRLHGRCFVLADRHLDLIAQR